MSRHRKTETILEAAIDVLEGEHPQTLRQCFYRLVSGQVIENTRTAYGALSNLLVDARLSGEVPWEWLEDRTRRARTVGMWESLQDFMGAAADAYRRDVWATQPALVEVWLEKDALSGIFESALSPYGVTLNVGRGYDGWDSIHNAAERYRAWDTVTVLYFGDHDPSGEDMIRSLEKRLGQLDVFPMIEKVGLTLGDVRAHDLPPNPTKTGDSRSRAYVAEHGDNSWELDALPPSVLRERVVEVVEARMDLLALGAVREAEEEDRRTLAAIASRIGGVR